MEQVTSEGIVALLFFMSLVLFVVFGQPKKRILTHKEQRKERKKKSMGTGALANVDITQMPEGLKHQQKIDWIIEAAGRRISKREANTFLATWDSLQQ